MPRLTPRPIIVREGVGYVPLTRGYTALVDAADVPLVADSNWHALVCETQVYARTDFPRRMSMHELLAGKDVDHANRDGLDNRRSNLRAATRTDQCANTGLRRDNVTGYRGITYKRGSWCVQIKCGDLRVVRYGYPSAVHAALAYDALARAHFGEFASLNFPTGYDGDLTHALLRHPTGCVAQTTDGVSVEWHIAVACQLTHPPSRRGVRTQAHRKRLNQEVA